MQHVVFDIDGTLVESFAFDERCFTEAVYEVVGQQVDTDWASYKHVTDTGLLMEVIERHDLHLTIQQLEARVKPVFIRKVESYLYSQELKPIKGALEFLTSLLARRDVCVSVATGGWLESACLKLSAAGFNVSELIIASSNDHYRRSEIMKSAIAKTNVAITQVPVYFGDAEWDLMACKELGFNFVLVGNRFKHTDYQVNDFLNTTALERLDLM